MQPHFTAAQALWHCFGSKALYRDVFLHWKGLGFSYLLLVNILIITPTILYIAYNTNAMLFKDGAPSLLVTRFIDVVTAQIPPMQLRDGILSTEAEQPYTIRGQIEETQDFPLAIIDLEASAGRLLSSDAIILLTRDAVHIRREDGEILSRSWSEFTQNAPPEGIHINAENARSFAYTGVAWFQDNRAWIYVTMAISAWCGTLLIMFLYRALQAIIFGGGVIIFAGILNVTLQFHQAVRLASVAITPPIIIDAGMAFVLGEGISLALFFLLTLGYCFFAVHSNKERA